VIIGPKILNAYYNAKAAKAARLSELAAKAELAVKAASLLEVKKQKERKAFQSAKYNKRYTVLELQ